MIITGLNPLVLAILAVQAGELIWLIVLTAAWVRQSHRIDRVIRRISRMSENIAKISRMRHTGRQPVTQLTRTTPPPPFPVKPPTTVPMGHTGGRHSG